MCENCRKNLTAAVRKDIDKRIRYLNTLIDEAQKFPADVRLSLLHTGLDEVRHSGPAEEMKSIDKAKREEFVLRIAALLCIERDASAINGLLKGMKRVDPEPDVN